MFESYSFFVVFIPGYHELTMFMLKIQAHTRRYLTYPSFVLRTCNLLQAVCNVQNLAPLSTEKRGTGTEYGVQLADRATQILHIGLMTLCIAWSLSKVLRDKCEIPSSLLQLSVSRRYQVPSTSSNPGPATQLRTDTCTSTTPF